MYLLTIQKKTVEKSVILCADDAVTLNSFLPVNLFIKRATKEISANMSKLTHGDSILLLLERGS